MKKYTVYLVYRPNGEWTEGHLIHLESAATDKNKIVVAAIDELTKTHPELREWAYTAYLILEGHVKPFGYYGVHFYHGK